MVYIPGYGWYVILGLFNTKAKKILWSPILQLVWELGKGCSERKKVTLVYEYDHNTHLFYKIATYRTIFNLVINFLVGLCV